MTFRQYRSIVFLLLLPVFLSCNYLYAPNVQYRKSVEQFQSELEKDRIGLNIIEIDEQGDFWDRLQLKYAIGNIRAAQQGGKGAIVVVFVHGWKNDASPANEKSGNLHSFKTVLSRIADLERQNAGTRKVVGIYIAWRGRTTSLALLKEFSFWSRINAATRIASAPAATEAVLSILGQAKGDKFTRAVVVGHSFGGLIVEKALSQALVERSISSVFKERDKDGNFPVYPTEFPADLVVLVNPASPATFSRSLISAMQDWKVTPIGSPNKRYVCDESKDWKPAIVSITSKGDWATRIFFPIGSSFRNFYGHYRNRYQPVPNKAAERQRALAGPFPLVDRASHGQRFYFTHTEGHISELHSHDVHYSQSEKNFCRDSAYSCPCPEYKCSGDDKAASAICYQSGRSRFEITQLNAPDKLNQDSRYWVMQVPKSVVIDHTEIFDEQFTQMLIGLLDVTNAVRDESDDKTSSPRQDHE